MAIACLIAGCMPHAAYRAYQERKEGNEAFAINDNYLRVDPERYPVFSVAENREAPRSSVNPDTGYEGSRNPDFSVEHNWEVTHAFSGRFLIHSEGYESDSCWLRSGDDRRRQENCREEGKGHSFNIYVYVRPTGEAYGWQYMANQERRFLDSDKVSLFRIDDSGDWSGQPWFECVDRCDKLERMKQEEIEGGDPFGVGDGEEQGSEIE